MKNAVVFELAGDNARDALCKLSKDKIINIKAWFGANSKNELITHPYDDLLSSEVLANSEICEDIIYEKVYKNLYTFLDMIFRIDERPIYEYVNVFNMWVNYYYTLFKNQNVKIVIFSDNPHFGIDTIAKDVATAMGIETVLFMQSIEPNKFWAFTNIEDIGYFNTLKNNEQVEINLEEKFEKDLFYMKNLKKGKKNTSTDYKKIVHRVKDGLHKIKREDVLIKASLRISNIIYKYTRQYYVKQSYKVNLKKYFNEMPDLKEKYIYFPLHYQPEMTTSSLGGVYCDQLLAIERISKIIPPSWKIYIKENPKQTYYMRDIEFFKRLNLIPKAVLVKKDFDTYELIKHSAFVATIAGTAGWEAISGGKNVLIFGIAWYRALPGVFEYKNNPSVNEILKYKINHTELVEAYNELIGKAYNGILECGHTLALENYSGKINNELLYESLKSIIKKI